MKHRCNNTFLGSLVVFELSALEVGGVGVGDLVFWVEADVQGLGKILNITVSIINFLLIKLFEKNKNKKLGGQIGDFSNFEHIYSMTRPF